MHDHDKTAAGTLDAIRKGGGNLLLVCKSGVRDVDTALDEGRFNDAFRAVDTLRDKVEALADAQNALGSLSDASIVKVRDLEKGMTVQAFGELKDIEPCPNCNGDHCEGRMLHFEMGAMLMPSDQEIVVLREE